VRGEQDKSIGRQDAELFVLSALILYLELVLIRWIGTEIRVFAYLGNLILVICFFGVGLGCYLADRPVILWRTGLNILFLTVLVANPLHLKSMDLKVVTYLLGGFEDYNIWQVGLQPSLIYVLGGLAALGCLTWLTFYIFVPLGQLLGKCFQNHPRSIRAYSVNIAGSLAGVWLFQAVSFWSWSATWWFALAALLAALLAWLRSPKEWALVVIMAAATVVVWQGRDRAWRTVWSPYQKLALRPHVVTEGTNSVSQGYELTVNGAGYQLLLNLSEPFLRSHPELFDLRDAQRSYYNLPFAFKHDIQRLLIVGAGTGNNAAAALRHGVERIDCVEIDPQIYALGRELHPEHPYDSPHVRMVINDARAFFKQATNRYDAVWFALLDAHTLGSSLNNLRLDHYVYTRESFQEARRLLADGGLLIMNFDAPKRWVADRLFGMLRDLFGHEPLAFYGDYSSRYGVGGGATMICGERPVTVDAIGDPALRAAVEARVLKLKGDVRPTTDDWPYLYVQRARIPKLHLVTSLTILAAVTLGRRRLIGRAPAMSWHFFALGAAFLLLEVQTVSRATLLFGMTWIVNAIVISAVLIMILFSNLVASRWPKLPQWFIVTGLAVTVLQLALVPLDWFNGLTGAAKLLTASAFLTAPVFFAGLIFIRSFAVCPDKSHALGSNLIGALVGGLLESLSFVTGIRALVLLVGLFYAIAIGLRPSQTSAGLSTRPS
jgi:SAM-dependent methyltransferase